MLALEKLLILKSSVMFKQTPDDILMQLVNYVVKEELVTAGELIIKKDDVGNVMYLIAQGTVKIHDDDKIIATLGDREIFGELSAFTSEKRVASVTAITDCVLLKMSANGLYALMNFDTGLAKGIIQALCLRTRKASEQVQYLLENCKIDQVEIDNKQSTSAEKIYKSIV